MPAQLIASWLLLAPAVALAPVERAEEASEDSGYGAAKIALGEQISTVDSDESSLTLRIKRLEQAMADRR